MRTFLFLFGFGAILALFSFIQEPDLSVEFEQPEQVQPGTFYDLKVKVLKKGISGFSKFQLDLPDGFSAQLVEGQGGNFSFMDQRIKLIWVQIPTDDEFEVVFRISTDKSLDGTYAFQGKVSYIAAGNGRKNKALDTKIRVSNTITAPANEMVITPEENEPSTATSTSTVAQVSELSSDRTLSTQNVQPGGSFTVTLTINKGELSGLGKVIESLPEGFTASKIQNNGALFIAGDNQVKFLWQTLPADQEFEVSYKIDVAADAPSGNNVIEGMFSYYANEQSKQIIIPSSRIMTGGKNPAIAQNNEPTEQKNNTNTTDPTNTPVADNTEKPETNNEKPETNNENKAKNETESANADVNYRVQICATRKPASSDYFVKNNNVTEKIYLNMHEGWHKFTVGGFDIYKEARNHREVVKTQNKIKGPFVTAYNAGNRITVQEALMITNQKWVP